MTRHPDKTFLADCRHGADAYPNAIRKINEREAARLVGITPECTDAIRREDTIAAARKLAQSGRTVFVTRGPHGMVVCDGRRLDEIPGIAVTGDIDTVGAGDSALAGIAAALATGCSPPFAAAFGCLVASVTIRKMRETGTASPEEIRAAAGSSRHGA